MFEEDFAGFMDDAIAAAPDREARCGMSFQALMACQAYTSGHHNNTVGGLQGDATEAAGKAVKPFAQAASTV